MASGQVLEVLARRQVFDSERPFSGVLEGIFGGISQPDIGLLFSQLEASTSYEQFLRAGHHPHPAAAGRRNRVAYDAVASTIAPYHDAAATEVAERLDTEVLDLLRRATGGQHPQRPEPPAARPPRPA
jgi:hypothetical protein